MKLKIVAIYDHKTQVFMGPSYVQHNAQALRSFQEVVNDPASMVGKYPEDFSVFELGEFDDLSGKFDILDKPHSLASALSMKKAVPSLTQTHG